MTGDLRFRILIGEMTGNETDVTDFATILTRRRSNSVREVYGIQCCLEWQLVW